MGDRKRRLDEFDQRLKDLESAQSSQESRLSAVELRMEECQSCRCLRVEHSQGLAQLWNRLEAGEVERGRLRELAAAAAALQQDLQQAFQGMPPEPELQNKSAELSGGKRAVRTAALEGLRLGEVLEWVSKDARGAFSLRLQSGEPSRLLSEQVRKVVNWSLFVRGKALGGDGALQLYLDRGPAEGLKARGRARRGREKGKKVVARKAGRLKDELANGWTEVGVLSCQQYMLFCTVTSFKAVGRGGRGRWDIFFVFSAYTVRERKLLLAALMV